MSDLSRGETTAWRRAYLGAAAFAVVVLGLVAVAGAPAVVVASVAGAFILGTGLYLAAARPDRVRNAPLVPPLPSAGGIPEAARNVMQYLDDPLLLLDPTGRIVFANRAAEPLVGADAERKHISAVLRTPELLEAVERILAGADAETVTFSILVPLQRHFRASIVRTRGGDGGGRILIQIHDLTAVRRAEELRADFVANASHELRTPLAAVSGFIDTLRGHARNDAEARDRFLEIMNVEAARMRRLIDDLLSLTRIELNEHNPPAGVVDVVAVVKGAARALFPACAGRRDHDRDRARGAALRGRRSRRTDAGVPEPHPQRHQIRPREEHRPGQRSGASNRGAGAEGGQVFVAIEDEGEGIPREAIPRLTERFYRVDIKRSRERGGTGLGLAIVKHILNRHQGRLHIESTPGRGSTFTVFLPAAVPA